jgi:hypothetical protein
MMDLHHRIQRLNIVSLFEERTFDRKKVNLLRHLAAASLGSRVRSGFMMFFTSWIGPLYPLSSRGRVSLRLTPSSSCGVGVSLRFWARSEREPCHHRRVYHGKPFWIYVLPIVPLFWVRHCATRVVSSKSPATHSLSPFENYGLLVWLRIELRHRRCVSWRCKECISYSLKKDFKVRTRRTDASLDADTRDQYLARWKQERQIDARNLRLLVQGGKWKWGYKGMLKSGNCCSIGCGEEGQLYSSIPGWNCMQGQNPWQSLKKLWLLRKVVVFSVAASSWSV